MNQDPSKTGGFFSRMLHKITGSPAGEVTDPSVREREGPYSKEALNQMVERKRRNDAIRTQEFAELRQLRSGAVSVGQPVVDRASGFLSSMLGPDTRVNSTLQKINAIEAQMAQQWWRTPADALVQDAGGVAAHASTAAQVGHAEAQPPVFPPSEVATSMAQLSPGLPPGMSPSQYRHIPTLGPESIVQALRSEAVSFWVSPDLEEVAILFAHGEVVAAKARLLELLVQELDRQPEVDNLAVAGIWHAALDLYRAIGDEEGFEPLAIDYAAHFGRSAPLWFSMPQQLGLAPLGQAVGAGGGGGLRWRAPQTLQAEALVALEAVQQTVPIAARLAWDALEHIDAAAVPRLTLLLEQWASQPGGFQISGGDRLLAVLEAQAIAGDAARPATWWALRMAALRWLHRPEAFEQVALDYCVTYEVSPPSWVAPQCQSEEREASGASSAWMPSRQDSQLRTGAGEATLLAQEDAVATVAVGAEVEGAGAVPSGGSDLSGVLEGDATPWLQALQARAQRGVPLEIACDQLIRVDFVAAGTLLNWAADMQAQGYQLRLTQLHQLVAVFFQVIGIQEHAVLQARKG